MKNEDSVDVNRDFYYVKGIVDGKEVEVALPCSEANTLYFILERENLENDVRMFLEDNELQASDEDIRQITNKYEKLLSDSGDGVSNYISLARKMVLDEKRELSSFNQ